MNVKPNKKNLQQSINVINKCHQEFWLVGESKKNKIKNNQKASLDSKKKQWLLLTGKQACGGTASVQLVIKNSPYSFSTRTLQSQNTLTSLQQELLRVLNTTVTFKVSKFSDKQLVQRQDVVLWLPIIMIVHVLELVPWCFLTIMMCRLQTSGKTC